MSSHVRSNKRQRGLSFTELLVTIAIIAILSAIAVPMISRTDTVAKGEVSNQLVTTINRAVTSYRQCGSEITLNANASSGADETSVMALLTTADSGVVGSPYLKGTKWPSVVTDDVQTYRVTWNGRFFVVLPRGTNGTGLKINGI
ncbi:MAG: prepilin-type N-terminal cleavage/methylation domain-containing protein [Verrucomicrobiales bacterium]